MMKKYIAAAAVVIAVLAAVVIWMQSGKKHTVEDFSLYPCDIASADVIEITAPGRAMTLSRQNAPWHLVKPHEEPIDEGARGQLETMMRSKLYVDDKRPLTDEVRRDFAHEIPTQVTFRHDGKELCAFELGKGIKLPTVNSERRWLFPKDGTEAMRAFIPLLDFGPLLEQPTFGWRMKKWFDAGSSRITKIDVVSDIESFTLDTKTKLAGNGPWTLTDAKIDGKDADLTYFEIDTNRVETIISLINPLYVDDWAHDLTDDEKNAIYFGGKLIFRVDDRDHTLQIGSEADLTKHPEWTLLGESVRYVKFDDDKKIGVMGSQRLLGLYPSFDDMRSKKVWKLDSTQFARITIESAQSCVKYLPIAPNTWGSTSCTGDKAPTPITPRNLAIFTKTLTAFETIRYITRPEQQKAESMLANPDVQIHIYEGKDAGLTTTLEMAAPLKSMFRYARVKYESPSAPDTKEAAPVRYSPIFVMPEMTASELLKDLTK